MYQSINLDTEATKHYLCDGDKEIRNLSQINLFIGPNNSGKSRFMRGLFSDSNPYFKTKDIDLKKINTLVSNLKKEAIDCLKRYNVSKFENVTFSELREIKYLNYRENDVETLYNYILSLENLEISNIYSNSGSPFIDTTKFKLDLKSIIRHYHNKLKSHSIQIIKRENIYIPTLRGLRGNDYSDTNYRKIDGKDTYTARTKNDYFANSKNIENKIYTGLNIYNDIKRHLLGHTSQRAKVRDFEKFLGDTFFEGKNFTIIPHIEDDSVHIKIGDDDDFPIYKLGEGIQSIIILTYPLFFNEEKNLNVFYEEPDLFLHPSFQRILLETLSGERFPNFQFFITTHSNHFLDMTLDFSSISIYTFQKTSSDTFEINNVKNDDTNILEILGIKNSSVFLSNCTIWVEGITDRIYMRKYLELIQRNEKKKLLEDIHYSFVEYGGNNITHWSFLESNDVNHNNIAVEKLCGKLFLVADQDSAGSNKNGAKSKKLLRQEELKNTLGERFYVFESKEIENLLTEDILTKIIKEIEGNDGSGIDFKKLKRDKYKNQSLGKFIETNVSGINKKYASESGTIKDKVTFAKKAVQHMISFDDLSDEAKDLTTKIYNFIKNNNP